MLHFVKISRQIKRFTIQALDSDRSVAIVVRQRPPDIFDINLWMLYSSLHYVDFNSSYIRFNVIQFFDCTWSLIMALNALQPAIVYRQLHCLYCDYKIFVVIIDNDTYLKINNNAHITIIR